MQYTCPSTTYSEATSRTRAPPIDKRRSGAIHLYQDVGEPITSTSCCTNRYHILSSPQPGAQPAHFPSLATLFRRRLSTSRNASSSSATSTRTSSSNDFESRQSSRQVSPSRRIFLALPHLRPAKPTSKARPVSESVVISTEDYAAVMSSGNAAREERMRRRGRRASLMVGQLS